MSEHVLTDEEAQGSALGAWHGSIGGYPRNFLAVARAVEQAVLAKIALKVDTLPRDVAAIVGKLKADMERAICRDHVTEHDARKRERAAWDAALKAYFNRHMDAFNFSGHTWQGTDSVRCDKDRLYPSPTCDKCGQELP